MVAVAAREQHREIAGRSENISLPISATTDEYVVFLHVRGPGRKRNNGADGSIPREKVLPVASAAHDNVQRVAKKAKRGRSQNENGPDGSFGKPLPAIVPKEQVLHASYKMKKKRIEFDQWYKSWGSIQRERVVLAIPARVAAVAVGEQHLEVARRSENTSLPISATTDEHAVLSHAGGPGRKRNNSANGSIPRETVLPVASAVHDNVRRLSKKAKRGWTQNKNGPGG